MSQATRYLIGEHDFKSFCSADTQADSTVRRIETLEVQKTDRQGQEIVIRVSGNGFLYNMVRIIAGTLMEVGRGHIAPQAVKEILEAKDRKKAGPTAPACGLTLVGIEFEKRG